ncbi:MAG: hypothetical protein OEW95_12805 [Candidatus Bathyarchaeota archaeon]|nr:hypothetical protein [Candidatus Bathyarchaeota archaeon]
MALDKKSVLVLIVLGVISAYFTLYTVTAYSVARYALGGGGWRYTPPGSFLPWPREPGMFPAISKMSESDLFIYQYLIKSWVLAGATVFLWTITSLYLSRTILRYCAERKNRRFMLQSKSSH